MYCGHSFSTAPSKSYRKVEADFLTWMIFHFEKNLDTYLIFGQVAGKFSFNYKQQVVSFFSKVTFDYRSLECDIKVVSPCSLCFGKEKVSSVEISLFGLDSAFCR